MMAHRGFVFPDGLLETDSVDTVESLLVTFYYSRQLRVFATAAKTQVKNFSQG